MADPLYEVLSPLEYMFLADRERVISALLAWVLGEHSTLSEPGRARLLHDLIPELSEGIRVIRAGTEDQNIDVLVEVCLPDRRRGVVAIENKLKIEEHSQQLEANDQRLAGSDLPVFGKVFLTLTGIPPHSGGGWRVINYSVLASALTPEVGTSNYVRDFYLLIARLVEAVRRAIEDPEVYAQHLVFADGRASSPSCSQEFADYVKRMHLVGTLQKAWMHRLFTDLHPDQQLLPFLTVGDGHRVRDVIGEVYAKGTYGGIPCRVGVQVQGRKAKVFASPLPPGKNPADDNDRATVDAVIADLATVLTNPPKPSHGKKEYFRSYPYAMDGLPDQRVQERHLEAWVAPIKIHLQAVECWLASHPGDWLASHLRAFHVHIANRRQSGRVAFLCS